MTEGSDGSGHAVTEVERTQEGMAHDVWLPAEIVELRARAPATVEKRLAPHAREIGSREGSPDSFPREAFRGLADERLDLAIHRLRTRKVFGAPPGAMKHWQFTMVQWATEIECARTLYQKAAPLLDRGDRSAEPEAAMAKACGTRLAKDLVREAIQTYGDLGFARSGVG